LCCIERLSDGTRRLVNVSEITGIESDVIQMQSIFEFIRLGTDADEVVRGEFRATGIRPKLSTRSVGRYRHSARYLRSIEASLAMTDLMDFWASSPSPDLRLHRGGGHARC